MKRQVCMVIGFCCYVAGIIGSAYYGIWKMLCMPLWQMVAAVMAGEFTLTLFLVCGIKILFSTTLTGLIWSIGYIGYNYFKGDEDPDWDAIMAERMEQMKEHKKERQTS